MRGPYKTFLSHLDYSLDTRCEMNRKTKMRVTVHDGIATEVRPSNSANHSPEVLAQEFQSFVLVKNSGTEDFRFYEYVPRDLSISSNFRDEKLV